VCIFIFETCLSPYTLIFVCAFSFLKHASLHTLSFSCVHFHFQTCLTPHLYFHVSSMRADTSGKPKRIFVWKSYRIAFSFSNMHLRICVLTQAACVQTRKKKCARIFYDAFTPTEAHVWKWKCTYENESAYMKIKMRRCMNDNQILKWKCLLTTLFTTLFTTRYHVFSNKNAEMHEW